MKAGGYFTAPLESYLKGVMSLYSDSLAKLRGQHHAEVIQISRNEFYNQLLDAFVDAEYSKVQDELNQGAAHAQREWDLAEEAEEETATKNS